MKKANKGRRKTRKERKNKVRKENTDQQEKVIGDNGKQKKDQTERRKLR